MRRPSGGFPGLLLIPGFALALIFLGLLGFVHAAGSKTITIKVVFKYRAPDGTDKPIRYAYVEFRDSDLASDDIIASTATELDGSATFRYDSGMGDGLGGGRIDPYVRIYSRLMVPTGDYAEHRIKALETFDLEGFPEDAAVEGSNVWVGHSGGVTLFDFADAGAPKKICDFKGTFTYSGGEIVFYKGYAIVLVANDHLGVLKLKE